MTGTLTAFKLSTINNLPLELAGFVLLLMDPRTLRSNFPLNNVRWYVTKHDQHSKQMGHIPLPGKGLIFDPVLCYQVFRPPD